jgi:phosphatidylinositol alpha-1,6-mannosyltransferase
VRVLWITSDFHPDIGGIETYTERVTHHLVRKGHQIGLVTTGSQCLPAGSLVCEHFAIDSLDRPSTLAAVSNICTRLAEAIRSFRPELVHFASAGLAVYSDALPDGLMRAATVHGNDLTKPWQNWPAGDLSGTIRKGLARCAPLLSVSHHTASLLASAGLDGPVNVIPNACDVQTFSPRRIDREAVLSRYGISSQGAILLTVARLVPRKGHSTVAAALRRIERPVHWIVVGRGRSFRTLWWRRVLAGQPSQVTLAGWVSPSELVELYNACDIFVLVPIEIRDGDTLDSEGFGLVFLEAGACGKPVIGSAVSGCIDVVADDETGLLVGPGDPAGLSHAIRRLIDDPDLRQRLGTEARRRILTSGGWESVADRISHYYEVAVNSRHNSSAPKDQRVVQTRT